MKFRVLTVFLFLGFFCLSQEESLNYRSVKVAVKDSIVLDSASINPARFSLLDKDNNIVDTTEYQVNFETAVVYLSEELQRTQDTLQIYYLNYPGFLTKKYSLLDTSIISEKTGAMDRLYSLQQSNRTNTFVPFEGLNSSGSISRGITIGNNQNAVVNSELDLQITGKLSDRVGIRASIQDANIPVQEGGYSQNLNEFDQIFIELFSDKWTIRAGDIDLENQTGYFARFQKKIQGLSVTGTLEGNESETTMFLSGGVVRGIFARSRFEGQEGNQGPYKLTGPNGELFILIISGSERVYVNGLLLERGENADYVIDYNAGEVRFNNTFPVTSEMRIVIEYQYSDRNYTRFIGYGGGNYSSEKLDIGAYGYIESDLKNQPLQQNLSEEQVQILQNAGDDPEEMVAPSAVPESYSDNKILYKKDLFEGQEIFVFSNNPDDELFRVRFTLVGENQGNYIVSDNSAISRIFEFAPPVNGVPQGNYKPVIQLFAPTQLQVGGVQGSYRPGEKTSIGFELAASKQDLNLFSNIDNEDNNGFALKFQAKQKIYGQDEGLQINSYLKADYINQNFNTIERLYDVEFNRDWSIENPEGSQSLIITGLQIADANLGKATYEFQKLEFSENFDGSRHVLNASGTLGKLKTNIYGSLLNNSGENQNSNFLRLNANAVYDFNKVWVGAKFAKEDNNQRILASDSLTPVSQKFYAYESFVGVGDSTSVFVELGFKKRVNDSVRQNELQQVSQSNTYYLKSQLVQSETTQLSVFANYRQLKDDFGERELDQSLTSRILLNQRLWNGALQWNSTFETNSGVLPQQEFTFVEVEPGQGTHVWNDYNENGIQDLEEFEIAQFPDEAIFVRVLLPNQVFVKIYQNKFGQVLTINPGNFFKDEPTKKIFSKFYNQTSYLIDRKTLRQGNKIDFNPFSGNEETQLGLALNFRNILFFNRGKQHFTTSYTYTNSKADNLLSVGLQKNALRSHQLNFSHKFEENWLANFKSQFSENNTSSENFNQRNFTIESYDLAPKISYLFSENAQFSLLYQFSNKENLIGEREVLKQQKIGAEFTYNQSENYSINGAFNYISNDFKGSAFSPVAFQMLEGLQPDKNFTWNLLFQKSITKYLDANLSYFGRKSETSNTIHTGTVQLKAYF